MKINVANNFGFYWKQKPWTKTTFLTNKTNFSQKNILLFSFLSKSKCKKKNVKIIKKLLISFFEFLPPKIVKIRQIPSKIFYYISKLKYFSLFARNYVINLYIRIFQTNIQRNAWITSALTKDSRMCILQAVNVSFTARDAWVRKLKRDPALSQTLIRTWTSQQIGLESS